MRRQSARWELGRSVPHAIRTTVTYGTLLSRREATGGNFRGRDRNSGADHLTCMSRSNPRFSVLACIPALAVALSISLPAQAAEPGDAAQAQSQLQAAKRVRNYGIGTFSAGFLMLGVGAGLEHKRRTDVCTGELAGALKDSCDRSKMANISLIAVGTTAFIGGIVLWGIGQSRMTRARQVLQERGISVSPALGRRFAGVSFTARF